MTAPTVIIGLGGAGSTICTKLSKMAKSLKDRNRLQFVCIDTDRNDLRHRKEEDATVVQIQTSAPYKIEDYLKRNRHAREDWFPIHTILNSKTPTEGAGQVRAISRLALDEAMSKGKLRALDDAIDTLFRLNGDAGNQAIRVIIVSSLAGGTGSGIVIPIAMYIKHLLNSSFNKTGSVVRGFFLLPEIFASAKSQDEKASIFANAYASVRELDAFMRKGDQALENTKYKDLEFSVPHPMSGKDVNYNESPFNFCFLFDRRNADDLSLSSFDEYMTYAANTIYAQAISGASSRSNSSEDNAIKALIQSGGRDRFCGAGSAVLKYPYEEILDYLAGQTCFEQLGEEWLTIDKAYTEDLNKRKAEKKQDPSVEFEDPHTFYLQNVDSKSDDKGTFQQMIFRQTHKEHEDEYGEGTQWEELSRSFVHALDSHLEKKIRENEEIKQILFEINKQRSRLQASKGKVDKGAINSLEGAIIRLAQSLMRVSRETGRHVALDVFSASPRGKNPKPYYFQHYLKTEDGGFVHPNAVRYMVYAMVRNCNYAYSTAQEELGEDDDAKRSMLHPFDDPATINKVETANDRYNKKNRNKISRRIIKKFIEETETLVSDESEFFTFASAWAKLIVYGEGIKFFTQLASDFDDFYKTYPTFVEKESNRVRLIPQQIANRDGSAIRYTCTSQACLEELLDIVGAADAQESITGKLSALIFQDILEYSKTEKRPPAASHFGKLFRDVIIKYYKDEIQNHFAQVIDMDVISALMKEVEIERHADELSREDVELVAADTLTEVNNLASMFLEEPMGVEGHVIRAAAYNPAVLLDDDPLRHDFVQKYLNQELGGVADKNISKYDLLVYKAVYTLNPGDFKRFRAPENGKPGGDYYEAYMRIYRKLGPNVEKNFEITPHMDRHWHLTKYMPDLDDRNQKIVEDGIFQAFLWGMLTGDVDQKVDSNHLDGMDVIYKPSNSSNEDFIVPNGTSCDELYEVLDALSINPPQVDIMLRKMEAEKEKQVKKSLSLAQSTLIRRINWLDEKKALGDYYDEEAVREDEPKFVLREFIPVKSPMKPSVFDLLFWLKYSMPNCDYYLSDFTSMIDNLIALIENYVSTFTGEDEMYAVAFSIISDQFQLFLNNMTDYVNVPKPAKRFDDESVTLIRDRIDEIVDNKYLYKLKYHHEPTMKELYDRKYQEMIHAAAKNAEEAKNGEEAKNA